MATRATSIPSPFTLTVAAPDVQTPWAAARDIQLLAALAAPANAPTNV